MKKILYISANSKPEDDSASKTVARKLINEVLNECRYRIPQKLGKKLESTHDKCNCKDDNKDYTNGESSKQNIEKTFCEEKNASIVCEEKISNEIKKPLDEKNKSVTVKNNKDEVKDCKTDNKAQKPCCSSNEKQHESKEDNCCSTDKKHTDDKCCEDHKGHSHHGENCCGEGHSHKHQHDHMKEYSDKIKEFIYPFKEENEEWKECNEFVLEEIDLFKDYIPNLTHELYECRNTLVEGTNDCFNNLTDDQKKDSDRIKELAMQFKDADIYIIAAPVWSLLFPAPLKQYIDCIMLNGITASINKNECKGLLDDKERKMVFVESVGGEMPILIKHKLDHSCAYLKDIAKFLKISKFEELLVDGTGYTEHEKQAAIEEAFEDIPHIVKMLIK